MDTLEIHKPNFIFPIKPERDADVLEVISANMDLFPDRAGIDSLLALSVCLGMLTQALVKQGVLERDKAFELIFATMGANADASLNNLRPGLEGGEWVKH
jgi:hypothetical protein